MQKILKIVLIVLSILGIVFWVLLPGKDVPESVAMDDTYVNMIFYIAYVLLAIPILALLVYSVKNLVSSPAKLKKALISIVGFVIVLALSYALASGSNLDLQSFIDKGIDVDEAKSKMVGAGLIAFYVLAAIAVVAMLLGGVKKILNK